MTGADVATVTETWLYAGQRIGKGDKLIHAWVEPNGDLVYFRKISGTMPGQAYAMEVSRTEGHVTMHGHPRYLAEQGDRHATDRQREEWTAEHKAAQQIIAGRQAEKAAAKDDEVEAALDVLRRYHDRLRAHGKRAAFRQWVDGEITRAPREERS